MDELIDMVARVMKTGRSESLTGSAADAFFDKCSENLYRAAELKRQEEMRALQSQPFTIYR